MERLDLNVLVVDDHEINREFLKTALSDRVGSIELASSGHVALECCARQQYDLILMDLHMPGLDGLQTAQQVLALDSTGAQPMIVFLSADTRADEHQRLIDAGFEHFLSKPVSLDALVELIGSLTGSSSPAMDLDSVDTDSSLIDQDRALAQCGQDPALVRRMQTMLARELETALPDLDRALEWPIGDQAFNAASSQLHQWAGGCGYAGALALERSCRQLDKAIQAGNAGQIAARYVEFMRLASATRQALMDQQRFS